MYVSLQMRRGGFFFLNVQHCKVAGIWEQAGELISGHVWASGSDYRDIILTKDSWWETVVEGIQDGIQDGIQNGIHDGIGYLQVFGRYRYVRE